MDYNILIGGAAGQGLNTVCGVLEKLITRAGYYVFFTKDYMSRVRGGHNFNQLRFSEKPLYSQRKEVNLIVAFNEETIEIHKEKLAENGVILCSEDVKDVNAQILNFEFKEIAKTIGNVKVFGTIMAGVITKLFNLPLEVLEEVLQDNFSGDILVMNIEAARKGYQIGHGKYDVANPDKKERITIDANQAVGLGALAAGCTFFAGYPMTPGTGVMNYIASKQNDLGIIVEQAEDEISALNMVLGASYAGARAMTSTSGGGFCLMVEAVGLAGMIETPAVIVNVQRPGPATGLPTRTAQGDLHFVIRSAQDEFPRMVIAVRHPEEAFYQTARAFNLADKYQIPVIILSDQHLADTGVTIDPYDFSRITIDRYIASEQEIGSEAYRRYKVTDSGVSPRIIPGKVPGQVILADSDEHDEFGHIIEDGDLRNQMMDKRMRKMNLIAQDIEEPWLIGDREPEVLFVAWGSTYGPLKEALELICKDGMKAGALVFGDIWPLPIERYKRLADKAKRIISIEGNYSGQLADLLQQETCIRISERMNKYDGRPWSGDEIYKNVREVL